MINIKFNNFIFLSKLYCFYLVWGTLLLNKYLNGELPSLVTSPVGVGCYVYEDR